MKRKVIIAVAAAAAVIGGGTVAGATLGSDDEASGGNGQTVETSTAINPAANDDVADGDASSPDDGSAAERAVETALTEAPGVVTEIERDADDGDAGTWEVGVRGEDGRWHHVRVSQDGTAVVDTSTGDDDQDELDDARRLLNDEGTDIATAIRLAEDHTSATFREADLDDGRWHVELRGGDGAEYELDIDLATGEITGEEQDQDDNDDNGNDDNGNDDNDNDDNEVDD
jgi:uncharacterized membrane protein YkoI